MNSREHHEFMVANVQGYKNTAEDKVCELVNELIDYLYYPVWGVAGGRRDKERCTVLGIAEEPINWGSLRCIEAKKFADGSFLVTISEASAGDCPTFCGYIERFMKSFGWDCKVETEW